MTHDKYLPLLLCDIRLQSYRKMMKVIFSSTLKGERFHPMLETANGNALAWGIRKTDVFILAQLVVHVSESNLNNTCYVYILYLW
jgi:hypothetical protein